MADSGVYSADYLRGLKHRQSGTSRIAFRWPWEPENIAFFFGGNILFGVRPVLAIRRDTVLGVYRDKFTQNDVRLLIILASYISPVIEKITLSVTDDLTGLFNRRHFLKQLEAELDIQRRYGSSNTSLIMMDIDHFKNFFRIEFFAFWKNYSCTLKNPRN